VHPPENRGPDQDSAEDLQHHRRHLHRRDEPEEQGHRDGDRADDQETGEGDHPHGDYAQRLAWSRQGPGQPGLGHVERRPDHRAHDEAAALTAGERRVAALAADGLSNRQTAEHLFVTQATVETHLRHAFRKLNITSRAELPGSLDA
jgi:DNA-binding CsgD family transcriptional regulator